MRAVPASRRIARSLDGHIASWFQRSPASHICRGMNSDKPRISVIIPAYNVAQYIGAALDSVFFQEAPAYEVIVVNDGSTDSTLDVLAQYANRPELRVISTKNKGQGAARNEGVRYVSGDYIYFFDADDLMDRCLISALQARAKDNGWPELILFSGRSFVDSEMPNHECEEYVRGFDLDCTRGDLVLDRIGRADTYKGAPSPCMYVVKRDFWIEKNIRFKAMLYEDVELFPSLLLAAMRVSVLDKQLFRRRIRRESTTQSPETIQYMRSYLEVARCYAKLYRQHGKKFGGIRRFSKKHAVWFANDYLKLGRRLRVGINRRALFGIAYDTRSWKTFRRLGRFCLLGGMARLASFKGMK